MERPAFNRNLIIDGKGTQVKVPYPPLNSPVQSLIQRPTLTTYEDGLEWNKQAQKHSEGALNFTQEYAKVKVEPIDDNKIFVVNMSDLHWGHMDVDYDYVDKLFTTIEETPNTYCVFGWNILDAAIPAKFPDGVMWSGQNAQEQVYTFNDKLRKLHSLNKILGGIGDAHCHEGWCVDEKTEFLTKNGWTNKLFMGQEILTFNPFKEKFEYQKILDIYRKNYKDEMYHIENDNVDLFCTPNHRFLYQNLIANGVYSTKLHEIKLLKSVKATRIWQTAEFEDQNDGNRRIGDNTIKLLAWMITEGALNKNRITIYQSTKHEFYSERIKRILHLLPISFIHRFFKSGFGGALVNGYITKPKKEWIKKWFPNGNIHRIPRQIFTLDSNKRMMFLRELLMGDGKSDEMVYTSKSWELASDVQELAIKTGVKSTIRKRKGMDIYDVFMKEPKGKNGGQFIYLSKAKFNKEMYSGFIQCPSTKNGTVVIRRNGKVCITGNSKRATGWMVYRELFDGINVPLLLNGGYLDVGVNDENYRMALFHKIKYWSTFNKTHGGDRAMDRMVDAEIVFTSHLHQAAVGQSNRYNPPFKKETAVVSSGTCKLHDKWARGGMGIDGEPGGQGIILYADRHKFQTIYDLQVGSEIMKK